MKKKRGRFLVSIVAIIIALVCRVVVSPEKVVIVHGDFSTQDVAAIKRAVKRDLRGEILPTFSWAAIKEMPGKIKNYLQCQIVEIDDQGFHDQTAVWVRLPPAKSREGVNWTYFMKRDSGRWKTDLIISPLTNVANDRAP